MERRLTAPVDTVDLVGDEPIVISDDLAEALVSSDAPELDEHCRLCG